MNRRNIPFLYNERVDSFRLKSILSHSLGKLSIEGKSKRQKALKDRNGRPAMKYVLNVAENNDESSLFSVAHNS